ncbi:MAG: hypothetical protein IT226_10520 [Flavobacteriales bacterium]|nr:hypothetical protein [Flavobacteriales bacterium]
MSNTTTAQPRKYVGDLRLDHQEWLNTLRFRKEDVSILERRLEAIVQRNSKQEVMAELEHFQNQFIREKEVIDELRHDIKQHENQLEKQGGEDALGMEHGYITEHTMLHDRILTFEKLYRELKAEFRQWLSMRP